MRKTVLSFRFLLLCIAWQHGQTIVLPGAGVSEAAAASDELRASVESFVRLFDSIANIFTFYRDKFRIIKFQSCTTTKVYKSTANLVHAELSSSFLRRSLCQSRPAFDLFFRLEAARFGSPGAHRQRQVVSLCSHVASNHTPWQTFNSNLFGPRQVD